MGPLRCVRARQCSSDRVAVGCGGLSRASVPVGWCRRRRCGCHLRPVFVCIYCVANIHLVKVNSSRFATVSPRFRHCFATAFFFFPKIFTRFSPRFPSPNGFRHVDGLDSSLWRPSRERERSARREDTPKKERSKNILKL